MKKTTLIMTGLLALTMSQPAMAGDGTGKMHGQYKHGAMHGDKDNPCAMEGMHGDMTSHHGKGEMGVVPGSFLVKKEVDGYTVSFHVMQAKEGMSHGGTHNVMFKVEKDGKALTDLVANSKVGHPNGKSESKMPMKMGDWYMTSYDLDHPGKHQLMLLFKTPDGKKHFGGAYYPDDKQD